MTESFLTKWERVIKGIDMDNPVQDAEPTRATIRGKAAEAEQGAQISRPGPVLEAVADAIDAARYAHPEHPRERPMPFAQAHRTDREYAFRLACAALSANRWLPIETAPHDVPVLLGWRDWRDHQWCMEVGPASHGWRRGGVSNMSKHGSATHWMPLPVPPK